MIICELDPAKERWRLRKCKESCLEWLQLGCVMSFPLTGDPRRRLAIIPGAASVYDLNSVELISISKRLNETTVELSEFARGV